MSPDAERPGHIDAASVGARGLLGFYGSTPAYRSVLEIEGRGDLQPELNALSKTGDIMTMIDLVDDDLLRTLAVVGTPEECAAEIRRRFGDVADRVCAYFPGTQHPTGTIRALAEALQSSWPALFPGFHRTGSTGTARGGHRAQQESGAAACLVVAGAAREREGCLVSVTAGGDHDAREQPVVPHQQLHPLGVVVGETACLDGAARHGDATDPLVPVRR